MDRRELPPLWLDARIAWVGERHAPLAGRMKVDVAVVGAGITGLSTAYEVLKPGEGGVFKVNGHRLAVSRAGNGQLLALSPVCPHMGCAVHWNEAETTWDCPCHGSRFAADGAVINGPAARGLTAQELVTDPVPQPGAPGAPSGRSEALT